MEVTFFSNGEFVIHQVEDQDVGFDNEGIVQGATFRREGSVDIAFMAPGGLGDGCIVFGAVHGLTQSETTLAEDASGFNHEKTLRVWVALS